MFFPCVAAAAAAVATHSPAWFLSGAYHPPLSGKVGDERLHHVTGGSVSGAEISGEALTVALDVVQAWAVLLTLGFTLIIFFFLAFCVCSKKDDGYDEFEVTQGITTVKICHDGGENGVSFIPRITGSGTESMKATDETSEASSRYTLKRELPAIPTNVESRDTDVRQDKPDRPISQHSSDLYASVSDSAQGSTSFKLIGGVQVLPAGAIAPGGRAAVVKECVSSPEDQIDGTTQKKDKISGEQVCPPYAQVKKSHPYPQVSKTEHPYAKVTSRKGLEETDTDSYDEIKNVPKDPRKREVEPKFQTTSEIRKDEKRLPLLTHYGDPAVKKDTKSGAPKVTSPHSSNLVTSSHSAVSSHSIPGRSPTSPQYRSPTSPPRTDEPVPTIPAAMAISGRTPANEEMPYMTPPVLQPSREQSQHFSGDSQDSRGYTSISVREPLAALKARQSEGAIAALGRTAGGKGPVQTQGSEGEGYYMTVSDDSADEMYACIYEGSRGTGSETYAQIEPRTTPSQAPPSVLSASSLPPSSPTGLSSRTPQDPSPPAPPSVDSLRHVVHSRQASASSSASTGMGSPVAEKRGTRSPLPPLPQGDTVLYSPPEPPILSSQPIPKSPPKAISHITEKQTPRSLEEMYAKVLKKPHGHSRGSSSGAVESGDSAGSISTRRGSGDIGEGIWTAKSPAAKPTHDMSHSMVESRTHDVVSGVNRAKSCDVSASWGGMNIEERKLKSNLVGRNYESIPPLYSGSDPGYETVKNGDPPYASVDQTENYPGYETVRGSDVESEPGYETLKQKEFEPGYETVSEVASKQSLSSEPGYESVTTTEYEPGYETVSSKKSDPGYESVREKDKMEYDPGYEELSHPGLDRTSSETDPNYEQLKFSSRRSSQEGDAGYEVVKKDTVEGNYDLVSDYDTQIDASKADVFVSEPASQPVPLYASVKKKESPKKEVVKLPSEPKDETINENMNVINVDSVGESPVETSDLLKGLEEIKSTKIVEDSQADSRQTVTNVGESIQEVESKVIDREILKLDDLGTASIEQQQRYQVMDSPEEVELPPPGGEDNHRISPPISPEDIKSPSEEPVIESEQIVSPTKSEGIATETVAPSKVESATETVSPTKVEGFATESVTPTKVEDSATETILPVKPEGFVIEPLPLVSLTFTEASPPIGSPETGSSRSSGSSENGTKDSVTKVEPEEEKDDTTSGDVKEETLIDMSVPSAPPPQFSNSHTESSKDSPLINSLEDPLPPPPLPALDDDIATASPPPPPPPIPDEVCGLQHDLPPPPLDKEPVPEQGINGICTASPTDETSDSHVDSFAVCSSSLLHDLPPPLPPTELESKSENETDGEVLSKNGLNGNMTVTVNPMADIEETTGPPLTVITPITAPLPTSIEGDAHPPPPVIPSGESVESQSSGSTVNGNGSVESVVTIDPKKGGDPSTTVPQDASALPPLQHSSSTSSSDSKHSDPHEGITSV